MKSHPKPKASSSNNDDGDAGLYVRPLSIKILVPVSLGVASLSECEPRTGDRLLGLADERLYKAKKQGRNRTVSK